MRNHKPLVFILKHRVVGLRCICVSLKCACVTPKGHRILVLCLVFHINLKRPVYTIKVSVIEVSERCLHYQIPGSKYTFITETVIV